MNKKVTLLALSCEIHSEIPAGLNWFSLEEAHTLPLSSPQAKLLDKLAYSEAQLALF